MIKLLVVDDSALVRKLFRQVFAAEPDFQVEVARDGVEALEALHRFQPDVVTLDVHMPRMDGLSCLDRIMLDRPCPVVMVSALAAEDAEVTLAALRLGAFDFAAKPQGAVSLKIELFAPELVQKVRAAANARPRASLRLKERVRGRVPVEAKGARRRALAAVVPMRARGEGVVLVGASTGGPPALEMLLSALPAAFPLPILIAQHIPASFTGALAARLDRLCALSVKEVTGPVLLQPGVAYIGRGDADLIISPRPGALTALAAPALPDYPWHPSVDRLVRTALATVAAPQIIGVLMTGMGNDGAAAMTLLRQAGGRTIAEAEETAVVWGMPGELVRADGADDVLPAHGIAAQLMRLTPCP